MKNKCQTILLLMLAMQMVFVTVSIFPASAKNELISPQSGEVSVYWANILPWPTSSSMGLENINGEMFLNADLTVNLDTIEGFVVVKGDIVVFDSHNLGRSTGAEIKISKEERKRHIRNKVVPNVPLLDIAAIREQCENRAMPYKGTTHEDQFSFIATRTIRISSSGEADNLVDQIMDAIGARWSVEAESHQFPLKITCYDFIHHGEQTMAQVTPGYWMYDCRNKSEPLGPPLFVQGAGYAYVVMEGNGEERECVTQGSVTTEARSSVVWKVEDGGSWDPDN